MRYDYLGWSPESLTYFMQGDEIYKLRRVYAKQVLDLYGYVQTRNSINRALDFLLHFIYYI